MSASAGKHSDDVAIDSIYSINPIKQGFFFDVIKALPEVGGLCLKTKP